MRMRLISAVVFVLTALSGLLFVQWQVVKCGQDRGQEILGKYADKADHSRDKVKFHLALKLMQGGWTDVQKEIILRGINSPSKELESEAASVFTPAELKAVFYDIGSVDTTDLRTVYGTAYGKSALVHEWNAQRKPDLWRANFALGFVRFDLTYEQQLFLVRLSDVVGKLDRASAVEWEAEAVRLFSRDKGRVLFATVGDGRCISANAMASKKAALPQCVCTTAAGNWSCNNSCQGGSCRTVEGDCGFLWLYDCNGMCDNSEA